MQLTDFEDQALVQLTRSAHLAKRPGIVVLDRDLEGLDSLTESRKRSLSVVDRLKSVGRLQQVRRGLYVLVGQDGTVRVGALDLVGAVAPRPHLVTAGRALEFHDLSDQHFRRVVVLVRTQMRGFRWRGDEIRFVRTRLNLGGPSAVRSRRSRASMATPERAIVDSLARPAWGVSLAQIVEALITARERRDDDDRGFVDRLAAEASKQQNAALARRLGFLVDWLFSADDARAFITLKGSSKGSTPLLNGGPHAGSIGRFGAN